MKNLYNCLITTITKMSVNYVITKGFLMQLHSSHPFIPIFQQPPVLPYYSFVCFRMSYKWKHTECSLWFLLLLLQIILRDSFALWYVFNLFFLFISEFISLYGVSQFVSLFPNGGTFGLFLDFDDYGLSCCKHAHTGFCRSTCLHFSQVNI